MARAVLSVQKVVPSGLAPVYSAGNQVDGHEFANDGNVLLHVKNTGGGACTVTVQTPAIVGGMAVADAVVAVPATTGDRMIGPFNTTIFNQAGGLVYVDLSTATGVTLAAIKV